MAEKEAIYDYTLMSGKFNRPLSGYQKPWKEFGSGFEAKFKKGDKKVWIDYEGKGDNIRKMTDLISRSTYDIDLWVQRGCNGHAMDSLLSLEDGAFDKMTQEELDKLVDSGGRNYSFMSTAVSKGRGFGGNVIMNIYAPKGTQMMYAEPFSAFGGTTSGTGGLHWDSEPRFDGVSKQKTFGAEDEMIIQRGAYYKVKKIEKKNGKIYVDAEVHPEMGYDTFQQDPDEWKGDKVDFNGIDHAAKKEGKKNGKK
jgi:hypothetical protein